MRSGDVGLEPWDDDADEGDVGVGVVEAMGWRARSRDERRGRIVFASKRCSPPGYLSVLAPS